jgi:hypothetical protein
MASRKKKSTSIFSPLRRSTGNENYGAREFQQDFNRLVKAGILKPQKSEKPQPTEYALRQIRKFADVLSGNAQTLKIGSREGKAYREAGYTVRNGVAIVHASKGSKVKRLRPSEQGAPQFEIRTPGTNGRTKVSKRVLVPYGDLEAYVMQIVYDSPPLKPGEFIGFRFFGNNSIRYWFEPDAKQKLLEYFLAYRAVIDAANSDDIESQEEIYANFEIVIFEDQQQWAQEVRDQRGRMTSERRARNRERKREWYRNYMAGLSEEERAYRMHRTRSQKAKAAEAQARYQKRLNESNPEKIIADRERKKVTTAAWRAKKKAEKLATGK